MAGVFISYRQADSKAWAAFLRDELADVFEAGQIFLDRDTLHAGSWRDQIEGAVGDCNVTLVVIGKSWLGIADENGARRLDNPADVHRREIAKALARADMSVIPVLVDDAGMPAPDHLPEDIRMLCERQARRFSDNAAHRAVDVQELAGDIDRAGGVRRRGGAIRGNGSDTGSVLAEPVRFLPFVLDEAQARTAFDAWTRGLTLAPRDLPQAAKVVALAPAWAPQWLASASVCAPWRGKKGTPRTVTETVDGADGKPGTRTARQVDYTEVSGEFNERVEHLVIDAGASALGHEQPTLLDEASARRVQSAAALPEAHVAVSVGTVDRAAAEVRLRGLAVERARQRVLTKIGGTEPVITQIDTRLEAVELVSVNCPVFVGRYVYGGSEHAFCVNADTGEVAGDSPLSKGKIGLIVAVVGAIVALAVLFFVLR